jgi:hypothetical protein
MRFFSDPSLLTPVEWFFTDPAAPWVGVPNVFNSRNWYGGVVGWPELGEVEGATRKWSPGTKLYLANDLPALDRAASWVDGVDSSRARTSPPCTPNGLFWWLRSDLRPANPPPIAGWFGAWDFEEPNMPIRYLSPIEGSIFQANQFTLPATNAAGGEASACLQYITAPLPAITIPATTWTMGVGGAATLFDSGHARLTIALAVVSNTGALRRLLLTRASEDPLIGYSGATSWRVNYFDPGDVVFQDGDVLCLEVGFTASSTSAPVLPYVGYVVDAGADPYTVAGDSVLRPAAFLAAYDVLAKPASTDYLNDQFAGALGDALDGRVMIPGPGVWHDVQGVWRITAPGHASDAVHFVGPLDCTKGDALHTDYTAEVRCGTSVVLAASYISGLGIRAVDENNQYWVCIRHDAFGAIVLDMFDITGGVFTTLFSAVTGHVLGTDAVIKAIVHGATAEIFLDGVSFGVFAIPLRLGSTLVMMTSYFGGPYVPFPFAAFRVYP